MVTKTSSTLTRSTGFELLYVYCEGHRHAAVGGVATRPESR